MLATLNGLIMGMTEWCFNINWKMNYSIRHNIITKENRMKAKSSIAKKKKNLKKNIFPLFVKLRVGRKLKTLRQFLRCKQEGIIGNLSKKLSTTISVIKIKYGKAKNFLKTLDKCKIICYNMLVR